MAPCALNAVLIVASPDNMGGSIWARPKSRSLAPVSFTRTLAGFRSRCTIPFRRAAANPPAICPASRNASATGTGPFKISPSTYSITK